MAYKASDGKEFSMASRMRAHEHDLKRKSPDEKTDPLEAPREDGQDEGGPGSVHEHLMAMHNEMGGRHMHVHQKDENTVTTHHVDEDGKVQGPHDHANMEQLRAHMDKFLGEEEHEGEEPDQDDQEVA